MNDDGPWPTDPRPEPLVTVAIPCHDAFDQLERTLAGLVAQTGGTADLEVILVDNNSTDHGIDDLFRTYRPHLELSLYHQPVLDHPFALCRARNRALALARGEWFWTLDADSVPGSGCLRALRRATAAVAPGESAVFTGERVFVASDALSVESVLRGDGYLSRVPTILSASNYHRPRDRRFPEIEELPDLPHPWDMLHGGNTVFRRRDALAVGGYDEAFDGHWGYEDDEFAHRLITRTGCVPRFLADLPVYHQEARGEPDVDRYDKTDNPNWHRVCTLVPGYLEHKLATYARHGIDVDA